MEVFILADTDTGTDTNTDTDANGLQTHFVGVGVGVDVDVGQCEHSINAALLCFRVKPRNDDQRKERWLVTNNERKKVFKARKFES